MSNRGGLRRRMSGLIVGSAFLATLASCAPTVDSTLLGRGTFPPRPADEEILTFSAASPECPYEEIAVVASFAASYGTLASALEGLKRRARELGADAIVKLRRVERGGESARSGFTGTAVRFTKDDCRR